MNRTVSPNSVTYELNTTSHTPYRSFILEKEMISPSKGEVIKKSQKTLNYDNLLSKYHKLQNDFEEIIKKRNESQSSLNNQELDHQNILLDELKNKNINLFNQLNDRIVINQKLYNENNSLFKELESKKIENENLKEKNI